MKNLTILIFSFIIGINHIYAQETSADNTKKHLIIYRVDTYTSFISGNYKIWINNQIIFLGKNILNGCYGAGYCKNQCTRCG